VLRQLLLHLVLKELRRFRCRGEDNGAVIEYNDVGWWDANGCALSLYCPIRVWKSMLRCDGS